MRVIVYVEGPADRAGLEALLRPLVEAGRARGIGVRFVPLSGKAAILDDAGRKAADHIAETPEDWVIALPDLYPMATFAGTRNAHQSFDQMRQLIATRFTQRADQNALSPAARTHFRVHCLKHDLAALVLAAHDYLRQRLGTGDSLRNRWRVPVEDQNDQKPPKRIVEELFKQYRGGSRYEPVVDAPWILEKVSLDAVEIACSQRFRPFAEDLRGIIANL